LLLLLLLQLQFPLQFLPLSEQFLLPACLLLLPLPHGCCALLVALLPRHLCMPTAYFSLPFASLPLHFRYPPMLCLLLPRCPLIILLLPRCPLIIVTRLATTRLDSTWWLGSKCRSEESERCK
jgi:hypothetical protein